MILKIFQKISYKKALGTIFSEPPVDEVYEEEFPKNPGDLVFSVEYLPGQFDQRADSAMQCVKLLKEDEEPVIRTATTYVITAPADSGTGRCHPAISASTRLTAVRQKRTSQRLW